MSETLTGASDAVMINDIVLLCSSYGSYQLYAFSEGVPTTTVCLRNLDADRTDLSCCLFRLEINVPEKSGELGSADKKLERLVSELKTAKVKEALRFGMSVRLRHLHSGNFMVLDSLNASQKPGSWPIVVDQLQPHFSPQITLQTMSHMKRAGDDVKYGDKFNLTFQVDSLVFYSCYGEQSAGAPVFASDNPCQWFFRKPLQESHDTEFIDLFSYVRLTHVELEMDLGTDRHGKVVLVDREHPSTIWQLEPVKIDGAEGPLDFTYLKNIARQQYLKADLTLSPTPQDPVRLEKDSFHVEIVQVGRNTLPCQQTVRVSIGELLTVGVKTESIKKNAMQKMTGSRDSFKFPISLEATRTIILENSLFSIDLVDQLEARDLSVLGRVVRTFQQQSVRFTSQLEENMMSAALLTELHQSNTRMRSTLLRLREFLDSTTMENYSKRRAMLFWTGIHHALASTCRTIGAMKKIFPENTGLEAYDSTLRFQFSQDLLDLDRMIQSITEFLSDLAKGSKETAISMAESTEIFEEMWNFAPKDVYALMSSIYKCVSPLSLDGKIMKISGSITRITTWVRSLVPLLRLPKPVVYRQALVVFCLYASCYDSDRFRPQIAAIILRCLRESGFLPLITLLEVEGEIYAKPHTTKTAADSFSLGNILGEPGYCEYFQNYLELISCLVRVQEDEDLELFGVKPAICVQLAKSVYLGKFAVCGLKLVSSLILRRNRVSIHPSDAIQNNCFYPTETLQEQEIHLQFVACPVDSPDRELIVNVVEWTAKVFLTKKRPYDDDKVTLPESITYMTSLLSIVSDLIKFGHVTKFYFYSMEKVFCHFLLGFSDLIGKKEVSWISSTVRKAVWGQGKDSTLRSVSSFVIADCYNALIRFGIYMSKTKRCFQLTELMKVAFASKRRGIQWKEEINKALHFPLSRFISKCKTIESSRQHNGLIEPLLPQDDSLFTRLNTAEILENVPTPQQLLFRVALICSPFTHSDNEEMKSFLESVYGEESDIKHLLSKSELLETPVYEREIQLILEKRYIERFLQEIENGDGTTYSEETVRLCLESLQQLCNLTHPYRIAHPLDIAASRTVMRHLQVHRQIYSLLELSLTQNFENRIPELSKYCVQFFYNFVYENRINARELRKLQKTPLITLRVQQIADLMKSLHLTELLKTKDLLYAIDQIQTLLPKPESVSSQEIKSLYFLETFSYDFKNEPIPIVQGLIVKTILPKIQNYLADLSKCEQIIGPYLRLLAISCDRNSSMKAVAKALLLESKFLEIIKYGNASILKGSCDAFSYIFGDDLEHYESLFEKLLTASFALLFPENLTGVSRLKEIAESNQSDMLFMNPALMTINQSEPRTRTLSAFELLCSHDSGLLAMVKRVLPTDSSLQRLSAGAKSALFSIWTLTFHLSESLNIISQTTDLPNNPIHLHRLMTHIHSFLRRYPSLENEFIYEPSSSLLRRNTTSGLMPAADYENCLALLEQLIEEVNEALGCEKEVAAGVLEEMEIGENYQIRTVRESVISLKSFVVNSREFLMPVADKSLYFDLMLRLVTTATPTARKSLIDIFLSQKVVLDAVKSIIFSTLENKLAALNFLIGTFSRQPTQVLLRFLELLQKAEVAGELFRVLKNDLEDLTAKQEKLYTAVTIVQTKSEGNVLQGSEEKEVVVKPEQSTRELLMLECGLKTLELLQVMCDLCNKEFQTFLLHTPSENRQCILYEVIKQFTMLNCLRRHLPPIPLAYDSEELSRYNSFRTCRSRMHALFVAEKFAKDTKEQKQPAAEWQLNALSLAGLNAIIEMLSGPCVETQRFIGSTVNIYLGFNDLLENAWSQDKTLKLYNLGIKALLVLMDGSVEQENVKRLERYLDLKMLWSHLEELYTASLGSDFSQTKIETGTNVFMLLLKLKNLGWKPSSEGFKFSIDAPSYRFFIRKVAKVEIATNETIEDIYFPIPQEFQYMTTEYKNELLFDTDRSSQQNPIHDFLNRAQVWLKEMDHWKFLHSWPVLKKVTGGWVIYGQVAYTLVLMINIYLLFTTDSADELGKGETDATLPTFIIVLAVAQLAISALHIACYVIEFFPKIFMRLGFRVTVCPFTVTEIKGNKQKEKLRFFRLIYELWVNSSFLYCIAYSAVSVMALWRPYLFPFLLLDIAQKNSNLITILQSITTNWSQLLLTLCLLVICIYIFAVFGYVYFKSSYPADVLCNDFIECITSTISKGVQDGGGIGDTLLPVGRYSEDFWGRYAYDLAFFIIVIVVLLNVVFGIILDTFGELRDMRNARNEELTNNCYICGLSRSTLELRGSGWKFHITGEHSPFAYLAFLIYLDAKELDDCNGLEKYVKDKIKNSDTTFVPRGTCKAMEVSSPS